MELRPPSRLREIVRDQRRLKRQGGESRPIVSRPVPITGPNVKKAGCGGCQKRKEWLNKMIPGSGDLVEKITTVTGIKRLVDDFNQTNAPTDSSHQPSDH